MPATITALPTPPSRTDPSTFSTKADAFLGALPAFGTECNALAAEVTTNAVEVASLASIAATQVELAVAGSNYKGLWSALTGSLNKPASVNHNGNYWVLNNNLADVTAATPGISADWEPLNIGTGGASEVSSAVDITLTSASYKGQAISMTSTGKSVILPNATTLNAGAELFVIKNTGTIEYTIRDATGIMLVKLAPGVAVSLHLFNTSTSAGVWAMTGEKITDTIYQALATTVTSSATSLLSITAMSATQALATWYNASGFLEACTLNISGTTVTAGAVLTTSAMLAQTKTKVVAMSATQALVIYSAFSTTYLSAMTLNISGTAVTAGAALTVSSLATAWFDLAMLGSNQAVVVYPGTSGYGEARTLNISGTAVTTGAACVVFSAPASPGCIAAISGTQAVVSYVNSNVVVYHYLLTISGTTITAGASPAITAGGNQFIYAAPVSSNQVVVFSVDSTYFTPRFVLLEVSGGTVIVKDIIESYGREDLNFGGITPIGNGRFMLLHAFKGGSGLTWKAGLQFLRVHDSQISLVPGYETIKNSAADVSRNASICALNTNKILAAYIEPTGYLQTRVLEIGQ